MTCFRLICLLILSIPVGLHAKQIDDYISSVPEVKLHLRKLGDKWEASYCPDNTCEYLIISRNVNEDVAKKLMFAYLVYMSRYIYVREWQEAMKANQDATDILRSLALTRCRNDDAFEVVKCRFKVMNDRGQLQVYFVRFDEGVKSSMRIKISDLVK